MDNLYILLKNNKQLGPYTKEELLAMPLKSTDFVRIQGYNEGWQKIDSVDELTSLQGPDKIEAFTVKPALVQPHESIVVKEEKDRKHDMTTNSLSQIYVHFPVVLREPIIEEIKPEALVTTFNFPEDNLITEDNHTTGDRKLMEESENFPYRSFEEIKNEYATWVKTQPIPPNKNSKKQLILVTTVVAILCFTVVAWNKYRTVKQDQEVAPIYGVNDVHEKAGRVTSPRIEDLPTTVSLSANETQNTSNPTLLTASNTKNGIEARSDKLPAAYAQVQKIEVSTAPENASDADLADSNAVIPIRNPTKEQPILVEVPQHSSTLERPAETSVPVTSLVDVKSNYVANKKGGINSFNVTVRNRSERVLKLVAVDVFYYKPNKDLIGKKTLYFSNIKPAAEVVLEAAGNELAMSVDCKVGLISNGEAITYNKQ